ncbi:DUF4145 domain-containing protein [Mesorhizobium sp. ES1-4]|uniref:DUF4145 domain-containing protein n=1 Tax=Mesorhizobium sp. ES1-4 TaxID=2876627 RepID=UPI001CCE3FF8|nr:DUF4145 domain-containing protein [Mesorhizobium sp. ES1-4]MBZ9795342.1 DUF4145 domain-containing protein [Mesorhizobium sp. ES1-4]
MQTYFCQCTSCGREFLLDSYFSLSSLGALSTSEALAAGPELGKKMMWDVCFPAEYADCPEDVPDPIKVFYLEAVRALGSSLPNAAGAMFRKTLEAATLDQNITSLLSSMAINGYSKKSLFGRIEELNKSGVISPVIFRLADAIRQEGNAAVHDTTAYSLSEAKALKAFTESVLMQLFTIPAKLSLTRAVVNKSVHP